MQNIEPTRVETPPGYRLGNVFYSDQIADRIGVHWRHSEKPPYPDFENPGPVPQVALDRIAEKAAEEERALTAAVAAESIFDAYPSDSEPPSEDPDGLNWR